MPIRLVHDPEKKVLFVSVVGHLTDADIEKTLQAIGENADIPNNINAIWNLNEYCFEHADRKFFHIMINGRAQYPGRSQARTVLVAQGDLGFGMCRMYQTMCGLSRAPLGNTSSVARTEEAALDWLASTESG